MKRLRKTDEYKAGSSVATLINTSNLKKMIPIRRIGYSSLIALLCFLCVKVITGQAAQSQPVSLTLPATALHQALRGLLPLPVEPTGKNKNIEGLFTLDSISKLAIKKNRLLLQAQLSGRNISVRAAVGGQSIQIKLGQLVLPVTCDIALGFDQKKKTLFLTPKFYEQSQENSSAAALRPLLDTLSKEYAVPLDKLAPLAAKLGSTPIYIHMDPVDIQADADVLIVQFQPIAKKVTIFSGEQMTNLSPKTE
ncbi:MAG: hypothetical protein D3924_15820 [Candidatus Electrothrix sp. AR4]|nr:hypothetical protein [Candidatus Electrothrix sp. AR4]